MIAERFRQNGLDNSMVPEVISLTLGDTLLVWSGSVIQYGIGKKDEALRAANGEQVVGTCVQYWLDENPESDESLTDLRDDIIAFTLCDYYHPDLVKEDDFEPLFTRDPTPVSIDEYESLMEPDQPIPEGFDEREYVASPMGADTEDDEAEDADSDE